MQQSVSNNYQTMPGHNNPVSISFQGTNDLFDNKAIRSKFVTKVYSIVAFQLLIATSLVALFTFHQPTKSFAKGDGIIILPIASLIGFVVGMLLVCITSLRRSFPTNLILLSILTLSYGLVAAVLSAHNDTSTVLCAFGATVLATAVLLLMAKYTSYDMTTCGCGLLVAVLIHLVTTLILFIFLVPKYVQAYSLVVAGLGALLTSLFMIYDLQLIMGNRSLELSPEEYILGAVMLYIDIIQLFQYLLIAFAKD